MRYLTIGTDVKGLGPIVGMVDWLHNTVEKPERPNFDKLWLPLVRTGLLDSGHLRKKRRNEESD